MDTQISSAVTLSFSVTGVNLDEANAWVALWSLLSLVAIGAWRARCEGGGRE